MPDQKTPGVRERVARWLKETEPHLEDDAVIHSGIHSIVKTPTRLTRMDVQMLLALSAGTDERVVQAADEVASRWGETSRRQIENQNRLLERIRSLEEILVTKEQS